MNLHTMLRTLLGRRARGRWALVLLVAMAMGGAHGRQSRTEPSTIDPLKLPRPELSEPLILPVDGRLAAEKIVATMPAALRELGDPGSIRVIVSLHEPLAGSARRTKPGTRDAAWLRWIAAVEHDFVTQAGRLGFVPSSALSHFAIVAGDVAPERLEHLARLPQVRSIEPDLTFRAERVQGAGLIRADDLRDDLGGTGAGVVVVVLDSGVRADHPELAGKVVEQRAPAGGVGQDVFGHGTQVAGIIAGDEGLAPEAQIWDVKVLNDSGTSTVETLINALNGLMPNMDEIDVLVGAFADSSFVFNSSCDALQPSSAAVVQEFVDAGKFLIGAAGNAGNPGSLGVPACLSQILAAGSVYDANVGSRTYPRLPEDSHHQITASCQDSSTSADKVTCYTNGGPLLDFWAPAECARTPRASGGHEDCFGGTSAAAAYVAGVAAQLWSVAPGASRQQLENALKNNGPNIADPRGGGVTRRRIDAVAAFNALGGAAPTPTRTPTSPAPTSTPGGPTNTPSAPTPTRTPTVPGPTPTTPAGSAPGAPSNLTAQALSHTAVALFWTDNANNEADFRVEARIGAGSFQEVATAPANTTIFAVEGLQSSTNYSFRVRARNAAGNSQFSNTASATTQAGPVACVRDANTACLIGGQFRITGEMKNFQTPPMTFTNQVMSFAGGRAESDQAVFLESFQQGNFEIGVKMVDACDLDPGHPLRFFWTFFGGLTNQRTDITVMDTVTSAVETWTNPANTFPTTVTDTMAFPCNQLGGAPSCVRNSETACLLDGRFKVTGVMRNAQDQPFTTRVMQFAQNRAESDQAVFFQSFEAGNFEVGVKMVDACGLPQGNPLRFYWIFYGGLTNAETIVRAIHVPTGNVDIWFNPSGTVPTSVGRTMAFPCS